MNKQQNVVIKKRTSMINNLLSHKTAYKNTCLIRLKLMERYLIKNALQAPFLSNTREGCLTCIRHGLWKCCEKLADE